MQLVLANSDWWCIVFAWPTQVRALKTVDRQRGVGSTFFTHAGWWALQGSASHMVFQCISWKSGNTRTCSKEGCAKRHKKQLFLSQMSGIYWIMVRRVIFCRGAGRPRKYVRASCFCAGFVPHFDFTACHSILAHRLLSMLLCFVSSLIQHESSEDKAKQTKGITKFNIPGCMSVLFWQCGLEYILLIAHFSFREHF